MSEKPISEIPHGAAAGPMKWPRRILSGIFLLVLLLLTVPYVIGMFLGNRYAGSATVEFPQSPAAVFAAIGSDHSLISAGNEKIVERLADENGLPVFRVNMGQSFVTERIVERTPPTRVVREMRDSVVPITARWEVTVAPAGTGSNVTVAISGTIEDGSWHVPYFRFVMIALGGASSAPQAILQQVRRQMDAAK
ncbi:MAG: SRPBCC family protein [Phycisphaerae bacterium]